MVQAIKATVDKNGFIKLPDSVNIPPSREVTILIIDPSLENTGLSETALLSEASLAKDWNRPEEDVAWQFLQQAR